MSAYKHIEPPKNMQKLVKVGTAGLTKHNSEFQRNIETVNIKQMKLRSLSYSTQSQVFAYVPAEEVWYQENHDAIQDWGMATYGKEGHRCQERSNEIEKCKYRFFQFSKLM